MGFSLYININFQIESDKFIKNLLNTNKYENEECIEIYNQIIKCISNNISDLMENVTLIFKENYHVKVKEESSLIYNIIEDFSIERENKNYLTYPEKYYLLDVKQFKKIVFKFLIKIILEYISLNLNDIKFKFVLDNTFEQEYLIIKNGNTYITLCSESSYKERENININYDDISNYIKIYQNIFSDMNHEVITKLYTN